MGNEAGDYCFLGMDLYFYVPHCAVWITSSLGLEMKPEGKLVFMFFGMVVGIFAATNVSRRIDRA
jgi:hypothetical protein